MAGVHMPVYKSLVCAGARLAAAHTHPDHVLGMLNPGTFPGFHRAGNSLDFLDRM